MENDELIRLVNKELAIEIGEKKSYNEIHTELATYINNLIKNDFDKLITYLYRIDVNEQKLKSLLQQKIKTREQFSQRDNNFDAEEKW